MLQLWMKLMVLMLLMMSMLSILTIMTMMMIQVSYDYDDDTDDDNDHKNDSYTAAGAALGAGAAPGAESLRHVPRILGTCQSDSACAKMSWQKPSPFGMCQDVLAAPNDFPQASRWA